MNYSTLSGVLVRLRTEPRLTRISGDLHAFNTPPRAIGPGYPDNIFKYL